MTAEVENQLVVVQQRRLRDPCTGCEVYGVDRCCFVRHLSRFTFQSHRGGRVEQGVF